MINPNMAVITTPELAKALNVSRYTLWRWSTDRNSSYYRGLSAARIQGSKGKFSVPVLRLHQMLSGVMGVPS